MLACQIELLLQKYECNLCLCKIVIFAESLQSAARRAQAVQAKQFDTRLKIVCRCGEQRRVPLCDGASDCLQMARGLAQELVNQVR